MNTASVTVHDTNINMRMGLFGLWLCNNRIIFDMLRLPSAGSDSHVANPHHVIGSRTLDSEIALLALHVHRVSYY